MRVTLCTNKELAYLSVGMNYLSKRGMESLRLTAAAATTSRDKSFVEELELVLVVHNSREDIIHLSATLRHSSVVSLCLCMETDRFVLGGLLLLTLIVLRLARTTSSFAASARAARKSSPALAVTTTASYHQTSKEEGEQPGRQADRHRQAGEVVIGRR